MPLWLLLVITAVCMGGVGILVMLYADRVDGSQEITWKEYGISMGIICLVVLPLVGYAGFALAKHDVVNYHEFMNGWEARAYYATTECTEDGSCHWTFDCDPYEVEVEYDCGTEKDPQTCTRTETHYHSCPYVTHENAFYVDTTLGTYTIDEYRLPENPEANRWEDRGNWLPDYVVQQAGTGEPSFWTAAKDRLAHNNPWPVTKIHSYDNYVLASHYTILERYRKAADKYRALNLLPSITASIRDLSFYRSDKVNMVGCNASQYEQWDEVLERLNAAFGSELQGDVRLVIACDPRINRDPDAYQFALQAYWQNSGVFHRTALPKNTVVLIIGTTDGKTVAWGRAFTGMPVGNNTLVAAVRDRFSASSVPLNPVAVIGTVTGTTRYDGKNYQAVSSRAGGVLSDILWGDTNRATRFVRVSMSGKHNGVGGNGFQYLSTQIEITGLQKFLIVLATVIASMVAFSIVSFNDFFNAKGNES